MAPTAATDVSPRDAAAALRDGRLVVLPTETVYGVAGSAAHPAAVDALRALREPDRRAQSFTWHAPDREALARAAPARSPLHRRIIDRLTPGPVRLLVELDADELAAALRTLAVAPGVADDEGALAVRIPSDPYAAEVLRLAEVAVVIDRAWGLTRREGAELVSGAAALAAARGIATVADRGPTRLGLPSTTLRLKRDGGFEVVSEGAVRETTVRRRVERTIVFVCTGNTCRSPMAEALARHQLGQAPRAPGDVPIRVVSAGVSAGAGSAMTPDAAAALRRLGVDPGRHSSRPLTRELLGEADEVLGMTRAHLDAVADIDPSWEGRAQLVDPRGGDVPDPLGGAPALYEATARRLAAQVRERVSRWLGREPGGPL